VVDDRSGPAVIVCFYGHKGGAGRSAATANIAPILSNAGYRVIVVDFDLEAPGVHRFFGVRDEDCTGGVIDLVEAHAARLAAGGDVALPPFPEELLLEPRFTDVETLDGKLDAEQVRDRILGPRRIGTTTTYDTGVRVLPAGRLDARYRERVAAIDWATKWQDPAWRAFFGWLKAELEARAEVVFLDARAGVTELAALCLFGLADRVVILTPPTSQGFDGAIATARALRAAGRGPGDHGTLLVPSRVSKDADREHYGKWLHTAKQIVREPELLPLWTETRGRSQPERAAEEMLERFLLPELPVHAVGEPLVALRMLERGVAQDDLQDRYALLGGTIQRWAADNRREAAALEGLQKAEEVQARVEAARAERRFEELPALYGRLAEVKLETMTTWAHAREAAEFARQGAAAAALMGDEATELRLRVLEGKALLDAEDPIGAEPVLAAAAGRLRGREEQQLLSLEARARLGRALEQQEKDQDAFFLLQELWEEADALNTPESIRWRVSARRWAASELRAKDVLHDAYSIACKGTDRYLIVETGIALATALGRPTGLSVAQDCLALAFAPPRDASLVARTQFAVLYCRGSSTLEEWTRVIRSLHECAPIEGNLANAYINRSQVQIVATASRADVEMALATIGKIPHLMARPFAHIVHHWMTCHAGDAQMGGRGVALLRELRTLVETGCSRRFSTQISTFEAHLQYAESTPSPDSAASVVQDLFASFRHRPWDLTRGGWRLDIVAVAPLVAAVAFRDAAGTYDQRKGLVAEVLRGVAARPEVTRLVLGVGNVYLTPADRRTLLTEALTLPNACPEFKAVIQTQLDAIAK
jgi:cellulose biosynthesis protein BcsQ